MSHIDRHLEKPDTMFNRMQQEVLKTWGDGEIAELISNQDISMSIVIEDMLLAFVLLELSSLENCDTVEEGMARLVAAKEDLQSAIHALESLLEGQPRGTHIN